MSETKTATFIRKADASFTGDARLYRLSEPLIETDWNDVVKGEHSHVIVSATNAMFTGPETYIFPATEDGEIVHWGELEGSFRGDFDHERALREAGYEVSA